ncbi:Peptidoglycan-binding domain 1 protein [Leucobacter sp. 7(1)]|uniref:hypothetical protein n=1 Tax=Leucobacter sp. 7(1) TaxID=1255613 RepID=UPI00097E9F39|nr:hypothetical protein [Leucobacter sp. 7(1)]SJN12713.1 Peptidoglycan-binding domain 1 protein [Leucobacter sp. 7(1)]
MKTPRFRARSRATNASATPDPLVDPETETSGSPEGLESGDDGVSAGSADDAGTAGVPSDSGNTGDGPGTPVPGKKRGNWFRGPWSGTRLVALIAAVAVLSLLIGVAVMQFIVSPAELAARTAPPQAGPVTAPVELRAIENTVVSRGDVTYADAVTVTIDAGGGEARPVVTGHVPESGTVFNAGNIALEVAGRPVIVLPGGLPAYRTLSVGMRGPDVVQLKTALSAMGYWAGDVGSDVFEYDTASALGTLYEQIGYPAAAGGPDAQESLQQAERAARDAGVQLAQAQAALQQAVADGATNPLAEQAAVTSANDALVDAQQALATAQEGVLPTLPSSEALFLSDLPRRVDDVSVKRGDILSGSPMTVSGATLTIVGTISKEDAELLSEGLTATFPGPDGEDLTATVQKIIAPKSGGSGNSGNGGDGSGSGDGGGDGGNGGGNGGGTSDSSRYSVRLTPTELTPEQIDALRGSNVRVRIPVASTEGEVLAVPIAALSAGSGGEDRVELLISRGSGDNAKTENVTVTAGLAADGYVEIASDDPRIEPGAQVVVGE